MANSNKANGREDQASKKLKEKEYQKALGELQTKLVEMQEWVKATGAKVVVVFEGRDAAGKGGVIHSIMERVNPRVFRHVALPAPRPRKDAAILTTLRADDDRGGVSAAPHGRVVWVESFICFASFIKRDNG